jgi:Tol biopolymer transport system component
MRKLIVLAVLTAALVSPAAADAAYPGHNGKIAFASARDGDFDIYSMNPDGGGVTRLTDLPFTALEPGWSADGRRIAFVTGDYVTANFSQFQFDLWDMRADGSDQRRLTNYPGWDVDPSWSPDGSKIAFARFVDSSSTFDIFVMTSEGVLIGHITSGSEYDRDPIWSPDGRKIAYSSTGPGGPGIFVMNADGTGRAKVTDRGIRPDWSPDGSKIAFERQTQPPNVNGSNFEIFVMNADGSGERLIAPAPFDDLAPEWSPDGRKIVFSSGRSDPIGRRDVFVVNADGTAPVNLTNLPNVYDDDPSWQPIPNHAPACGSVAASPALLDPANRKLVSATLSGGTDPDGDPVTLRVEGVTQDEPVTANGDPTTPDAALTGSPSTVLLRAERNPKGDGRVYEVAFTASDDLGASCTGAATVTVPRHAKEPAVDSRPPGYDAFG